MKKNKGITLIALVITIIVLLILAGVSLNLVAGSEGILNKAVTSVDRNNTASLQEEVELAVVEIMLEFYETRPEGFDTAKEYVKSKLENGGIKTANGKITLDNITITYESADKKITATGTYDVTTGNIVIEGNIQISVQNPVLDRVKETGKVLDEINPTVIKDKYDNKIVVPGGFKIASDSADDVTGGVVIEDVSHGATAGSQFVWIPVGTIYTNIEKTESKTVTLDRYSFAEDGTPTPQGSNPIDVYCFELETSDYGNIVAKDIEAFKISVANNGGYYIGRYEARKLTNDDVLLGQVTIKGDEYIYNAVSQSQAAYLSRGMYEEDKKFTSDLMNSYAWDTAIVFMQIFGQSNYAKQLSLNSSYESKGTNTLEDTTKQDKICNIWDLASNAFEWTTETCTYSRWTCVVRGGVYYRGDTYTSYRGGSEPSDVQNYCSFRVMLYL